MKIPRGLDILEGCHNFLVRLVVPVLAGLTAPSEAIQQVTTAMRLPGSGLGLVSGPRHATLAVISWRAASFAFDASAVRLAVSEPADVEDDGLRDWVRKTAARMTKAITAMIGIQGRFFCGP